MTELPTNEPFLDDPGIDPRSMAIAFHRFATSPTLHESRRTLMLYPQLLDPRVDHVIQGLFDREEDPDSRTVIAGSWLLLQDIRRIGVDAAFKAIEASPVNFHQKAQSEVERLVEQCRSGSEGHP